VRRIGIADAVKPGELHSFKRPRRRRERRPWPVVLRRVGWTQRTRASGQGRPDSRWGTRLDDSQRTGGCISTRSRTKPRRP